MKDAERIKFLEALSNELLQRMRQIDVMAINAFKEGATAEELLDTLALISGAASAPAKAFMDGC